MTGFRSHLRLLGGGLGLCAWLLLVSHLCVDAGGIHAEISPVEAHQAGESQDEHTALHPDCVSAASSSIDRDHVSSAEAQVWLQHDRAITSPHASTGSRSNPSPDSTRIRSAPPLFLLHSIFLI